MSITTFNLNDSGSTIKDNLNANFSDLDTTKADLASPTFTGVPLSTTPSASDNSTKIATTAFVMTQIPISGAVVSVETTTGATHSLTTTAGQKVVVWAKGVAYGGASGSTDTILLKYNGVTKDTGTFEATTNRDQFFALQYTEIPGAGTADITVTGTDGVTDVVIIVMKIG